IKHIGRSATTNATKIDLQNLQSMLAELENAGPLTSMIAYPTSPPSFYTLPDGSQLTVSSVLPTPADVTAERYAQGGVTNGYRWLSLGTVETQFVMGRMRSVSANRQTLQ